jgi:hypothetical protein
MILWIAVTSPDSGRYLREDAVVDPFALCQDIVLAAGASACTCGVDARGSMFVAQLLPYAD